MKFSKLIKPIIPYGLVMWSRERKRKATFWDLYKEFLEKGTKVEFQKESSFKQVVSVQGWGHSGSSAVVDMLREYDTVLPVGGVDLINSLAKIDDYTIEVDFLRLAGGMLEIERYLDGNNFFQNDAVLQRFMLMARSTPFFYASDETRNILFEFFKRISISFGGVMSRSHYNTYLQQADERNPQIFFLRKMSLKEYRELCRTCINSLFATLNRTNKKKILVLDQFFGDGNYEDFKRNYDYCPNLKTIFVWRDPRDVFEEAKWVGAEWLPTKDAESFIEWFRVITSDQKICDTEDFISVRFEDLCLHYEETKSRIEKYLGLTPKQHVAPKTAFDPGISIRSVRLWQKYTELNKEYEKIAKALPDYLYKN